MIAKLALENGTVFTGESFGAAAEITGEVVFNTSMTGYQEILTDPSYAGQIVTMTYPLIGNYGVNLEDFESVKPQVAGFLVKEYFDYYSNFRANSSLGDLLAQHNIIAMQGIDTRMLTKMIRTVGALRGVISTSDLDDESLIQKARTSPKMTGLDLTKQVTTKVPYRWDEIDRTPFALSPKAAKKLNGKRWNVVVFDYGVKHNILRRLTSYGCNLTVVPSSFTAEETLAINPDGIFLSNGPGDPAAVKYAILNIKKLIGKKPIFGICLGHQLLALALGGKTFKLKFGHRGANHPVKNLLTTDVEITSQNHGFAVDPSSLDPKTIEITHINLNDSTNEGFRHRELPLFSVQYHPEASPGPHDSDYLFSRFIEMMERESVAVAK
ncbi:MAG: glutamine-hydrolyzing carbamoyl-phosphate synthase small subunit [Ignavibacteriales bacterium]|nr:glutamine-hydrolyzing carbamoyl-phosphate synthase small subunit [Ignavibacteriales bacterium]MBI3788565.1 glutamine-hydrolyzing carbamoyl-phosphate synthase small subunit [Ignavibacteriales bacterium]